MRLAQGLSASTLFFFLSTALPAWSAGVLIGAGQDKLTYQVVKGDTLESIAEKITGESSNWRLIASANQLQQAQSLQAGRRLAIPRELVPERGTVAQVVSAKGQVAIQDGAASAPGNVGEGSRIETEAGASVLLRLQDGTRILIEPGSKVILERMRQYYASDAVDARIKLESGRIEINSPPERRFPFEVKTQRGTAAVRGTEFRVASNGAANSSEVLRGAIAYNAASASLSLPAGDGVALAADSDKPVVERLVQAPTLQSSPRYEVTTPELSWAELGKFSYRATVTRDAQGLEIVASRVVPQAQLRFESPDDGQYFLHVRGISATGIEGFSSSKSFEVQARPEAPAFREIQSDTRTSTLKAVTLTWVQKPGLTTTVQLASDEKFSTIVHEASTTSSSMAVPQELYGKNVFFRFASVETRAGVNKRGPFGTALAILW